MRVGEPSYAIKLMAKIEEKALPEAASILRDSVAPAMRGAGFSELIVVARRREFEVIIPEAPAIAGSSTLSKLVAETPPHESVLGYVRRNLPRSLGKDVPGNYAHAMLMHHRKKKNPAAFERLRRERIAEQERLEELLLKEENWSTVAGFGIDCYAIYGSEADLKADTLDLQNNKMDVPHSGRRFGRELDHLLLAKTAGIQHTVVHRRLQDTSGEMFAMQTQVTVESTRTPEVAEGISGLLLPDARTSTGLVGSLVLGSRREGFSGGSAWTPDGLLEHRGEPCESPVRSRGSARRGSREAPVTCEVITLWETEADLLAGAERLSEPGDAPEGAAGALPASSESHTEYGALMLHE